MMTRARVFLGSDDLKPGGAKGTCKAGATSTSLVKVAEMMKEEFNEKSVNQEEECYQIGTLRQTMRNTAR